MRKMLYEMVILVLFFVAAAAGITAFRGIEISNDIWARTVQLEKEVKILRQMHAAYVLPFNEE